MRLGQICDVESSRRQAQIQTNDLRFTYHTLPRRLFMKHDRDILEAEKSSYHIPSPHCKDILIELNSSPILFLY